jgi:hypothetical protein
MENQRVAVFLRVEKKYAEWLKKQANAEKRTISSQFEVLCEDKMEQEDEQILLRN